MADTSVEIRDVVKSYGAILAVDHLTLEVRRGEFFSILGPSGCGKTSILRLLAGFERPDRGEIVIQGRIMHQVPPHLRPVNLVFQTYALFPHLTVRGNIAFGLEMRRTPPVEAGSRVAAALDMVKLAGKADRFPTQLSGGEQQRVALARALVNRPAVVLLDEPLAALDQPLRQEMQVELKAIQKQVGITFIYVTHNQEEALTMSDRVAVMNRGRVLQIGSPQDIYESPSSLFVANFIGVSNALVGRIRTVDGARCLIAVPDLPEMPAIVARCPAGAGEGARVTVLLRPERLHLSPDRHADHFDNTVPARIEEIVYSGNETQYLLRLSSSLVWRGRVPNADAHQKRFLPGESVFMRWNADQAGVLIE